MKERKTARVVLIDEHQRILLMKINAVGVGAAGEANAPRLMWVTLGGRIEEGENVLEAARREIEEETGLLNVEVGPPVFYGEQVLEVRGEPVHFKETFVLARTRTGALSDAGWSDEERKVVVDLRWFTRDELKTTTDIIKPPRLAEYVDGIITGSGPATVRTITLTEQ
jgi:8-oxo-dGTP pyrophosphatase MutT (NUDIX family)